MKLIIHVDAASRGNGGPAAAGVVVGVEDPPQLLHEAGYFLGPQVENSAEYHALIQALQIVTKIKGVEEVCIYSDSEPMVRQITGVYRVKSNDLLPLFEQAQMMLLRLDVWQIKHVDPEETKRADELVHAALKAGRDVILKQIGQPATPVPTAPAAGLKLGPDANAQRDALLWRVTLHGKPCPVVNDSAGKAYVFGLCTPAGLCVHAADAAFDCNPLGQLDNSLPRMSTVCVRCGATVKMEIEPKG